MTTGEPPAEGARLGVFLEAVANSTRHDQEGGKTEGQDFCCGGLCFLTAAMEKLRLHSNVSDSKNRNLTEGDITRKSGRAREV